MTDAEYLALSCSLPCESEEELPTLLNSWPLLGSQIFQAQNGWLDVVIYLSSEHNELAAQLSAYLVEFGAADLRICPIERQDWLEGYRSNVAPFPVGRRWWIDPHPDRPTPSTQTRMRLAVEPRMAFGSGSHESTQLILQALETLPVTGSRVLDIGAGSGILALAADRLEPEYVVAVDIDPQSIWVAHQICGQQEWEPRLFFVLGPVESLGSVCFDFVLCNMISTRLLPLAGEIRRILSTDGMGVLSGLLPGETEAVTHRLASVGLRVAEQQFLGEWASLTVQVEKHP